MGIEGVGKEKGEGGRRNGGRRKEITRRRIENITRGKNEEECGM